MKLSAGNMIGIVGGVLLIVSVLLPWVSVETGVDIIEDVSGLSAGAILFGIPLMIFGIIGLVMSLIGGKGPGIVGVVFGILALLLSLGGFLLVTLIVEWAGYTSGAYEATTGFGAYIAIIGSLLMIVGSAMVIGQKKEVAPPVAPMPPQQMPPASP